MFKDIEQTHDLILVKRSILYSKILTSWDRTKATAESYTSLTTNLESSTYRIDAPASDIKRIYLGWNFEERERKREGEFDFSKPTDSSNPID